MQQRCGLTANCLLDRPAREAHQSLSRHVAGQGLEIRIFHHAQGMCPPPGMSRAAVSPRRVARRLSGTHTLCVLRVLCVLCAGRQAPLTRPFKALPCRRGATEATCV